MLNPQRRAVKNRTQIIMPPRLSNRTKLFSRQRSPSIRIPLKAARRRNPKRRIYHPDLLFGSLVQLTYASGDDKLTFRTEKYDGDISGDYSAYEITENVSIDGADVTLRINGDKCYGAVWQTDSAYAIYSSAGLSREQTIKIIENIGQ